VDQQRWQEAKQLIVEALERPPQQRAAFLREQCADGELLAEVEALLAEQTGSALTGDAELPPPGPPSDLSSGGRIGPYVVLRPLGRGGMGEVFLGRDERLRRNVALKALCSPALVPGDFRSHVLREARAAARISHPNVATVYDVLEHGDGALIVMEYVDGESLAVRLRRSPPTFATTIAIGRQLAAALTAAHGMGVVHRDLKPANVQITATDQVKVLDFGLARVNPGPGAAGPAAIAAEPETQAHLFGTPGYMSPEHWQRQRVDERSDIFSLGLILFELVTGRGPVSSGEALDRLISSGAIPPRPDSLNPSLPPALCEVIERALHPLPDRRWQSARDVEAALARLLRPDLAHDGMTRPPAHLTFTVALAGDDWEPLKSGWHCPALNIPSASLRALRAGGVAVSPASFSVEGRSCLIRWAGDDPPREVLAEIDVAGDLSTAGTARRWRRFTVGALAAAGLIAAVATAAARRHLVSDRALLAQHALVAGFGRSNDFLTTEPTHSFAALLGGTRRDAWFAGATFYISVDQFHDLLLAKLREGVNLHFLILDPDRGNARRVAGLLGVSEDELYPQCLAGIRTLRRLEADARRVNAPGALRVKLLDQPFQSRFYLFDPGTSEGYSYFIPQVNGINSQMVPGFLAANGRAAYPATYFDGLLRLWNGADARELSDWVAAHPELP
jgi:serine/threonine protein kinase